MYSWSIDVSIALLGAWTAGHGVAAFRRRGNETRIVTSGGEVALACAVLLLGAALYVAGSPFDTTEPRVHISLVRRLVNLASPTPYTLYVTPEVVYTYPFPGTHYLLALMSRAGDIDPLFLYYKTRAIWGMAAVTMLYGCVRALFGNPRLAIASAFVAVGLVANGAFGAVANFSWAQLAPLSHASDIAMGVLLPALLLMSFIALQASELRERRFFLASALGLALMLVMVHPREIVQFLVYLTAFAVVAVWVPAWRVIARRAAVLVIATLAILLFYRVWQQTVVPGVDALVESERSGLAEIFRAASAADLVGFPLPLLRNYMVAFEPVFHGWNSDRAHGESAGALRAAAARACPLSGSRHRLLRADHQVADPGHSLRLLDLLRNPLHTDPECHFLYPHSGGRLRISRRRASEPLSQRRGYGACRGHRADRRGDHPATRCLPRGTA